MNGSILQPYSIYFFFFNATPPTQIYTLSLHDALPICVLEDAELSAQRRLGRCRVAFPIAAAQGWSGGRDRKSTRLNSSHMSISYAVFCLKKKNNAKVTIQSLYSILAKPHTDLSTSDTT